MAEPTISKERAAEIIERLIDAAQERGCPTLRDCMSDESEWLAEELAAAVEQIMGEDK